MIDQQLEKKESSSYFHLSLIVSISLFFLDQLTKYLTFVYLPPLFSYPYSYPYGGIGVFKNFFGIEFSLNHLSNSGAAWGLLGEYQIPLLLFRILLIMALLYYFFKLSRLSLLQLPLALIISGAVGNVCDYFLYGHVIDMFHFVLWGYDFPIFNVADSAICIGIGLAILFSWLE